MSQAQRSWTLFVYDLLLLLGASALMLIVYPSSVQPLEKDAIALQMLLSVACVFLCRLYGGIYKQVWRYGGSKAYLRLILTDAAAGVLYCGIQLLPFEMTISVLRAFSIGAINLLLALLIRHLYQYIYEQSSQQTRLGRFLGQVGRIMAGLDVSEESVRHAHASGRKINVAIIGAGRVGAMLADELQKNPRSAYEPRCFVDIDKSKIGRHIMGVPVLSKEEATAERLSAFPIQEIVFALPEMPAEKMKRLYEHYQKTGCRLKVYDYPMKQAGAGGKRQLREFDVEELLFRKPLQFVDEKTSRFYQDKRILISGGGGSIGSELCRQIARMKPRQIVILDVNENDTYTLQQKLRQTYGDALDLRIEIASVCDRAALEQIFERCRPQVVLHAAAHKHVPLMEHNCCEAVKNNVFGTLNMVEVSERFGVEKFIMISTDKAVNPTNVMGATKRMCEMIVQSRRSATAFSATRFGNVLGSNGSVIPLFKSQIQNGGPVTLTDRRIIRYFMTIPEASQLVLQSGAMARSGELYVLDMGKPVRILTLAENMIRLSGFEPYKEIDIIETGLRPGEKLYEELLIKTEELDKTENRMIFVERDKPLSAQEIDARLQLLRTALATGSNDAVRDALMQVVPTYRDPGEVNAAAAVAAEMKQADKGMAG